MTPRVRRDGTSYIPTRKEMTQREEESTSRRSSILGSMSQFLDDEVNGNHDNQSSLGGKKTISSDAQLEVTKDGKKRIVFELGDAMGQLANGTRIPLPMSTAF